MARLGKSLTESVAAGLLSLGGFHAPVAEAMRVWERGEDEEYLRLWTIIPGFGSSWYTGEPDPLLAAFGEEALTDEEQTRLSRITADVQTITQKHIFPNAAMYTAIVAARLGYDPEFAASLLVRGRVDTWCLIWAQNYRGLA
jgi:citrate synthase